MNTRNKPSYTIVTHKLLHVTELARVTEANRYCNVAASKATINNTQGKIGSAAGSEASQISFGCCFQLADRANQGCPKRVRRPNKRPPGRGPIRGRSLTQAWAPATPISLCDDY